jgi:transcriptional regulator with GAF, ATPase, and Fis domain
LNRAPQAAPDASSAEWLAFERMLAGLAMRFANLPAQGLDAEMERAFVRAEGIRAQMCVPVHEGGGLVGLITLVAFHETRVWPDELVARLSTVGHLFAQTLARTRAEGALRAALAEIRTLKERLEAENAYLRDAARPADRLPGASRSPAFQRVLDEIAQVAPTPASVLLLGETGSGKDMLAEALHQASPRRARPMIRINCAALPAALIEAELFGREKGAFTGALARQPGRFELADGSTLFLDEIGEMPLELQTRLLRVLQDGRFERVGGTQTLQVDVRLVAATNRDLAREVAAGRFREDLYYRLNVFPIEVPALRERREDIPTLAWAFVREFSASIGKPIERIAEASMAALLAHCWPGNVRELRNVIERAIILARSPTLHIALGPAPTAEPSAPSARQATLEQVGREHLLQVLQRCGWRIRGAGGAAELLGLRPTTLESRLKRLGLKRPRSDPEMS